MAQEPFTLVILGATSAVAVEYARQTLAQHPEGARLILLGRKPDRLEALTKDYRARGALEVETVSGDLGAPAQVNTLFEQAMAGGKPVDQVLLAYGVLGDQTEAQADAQILTRLMETNYVSAALWLERFAAKFLDAGRGHLVVLGSVAGDRGRQSNYHYGACKSALERVCEGMAHRFFLSGKKQVHITLIKPGFIDSPMTAHLDKGGPLWSQPDQIAKIAHKAVKAKRMRIYAPWYWRWILVIVRALPAFVIVRTRL